MLSEEERGIQGSLLEGEMLKCKSLSEISLRSIFNIFYFPQKQKIFFKTVIDYSLEHFEDPSPELEAKGFAPKYLGLNKGVLSLRDHPYFFDIEKYGNCEHLLSNQKFTLRIPDTVKYLQSISESQNGTNQIRFADYDSKYGIDFEFHLRKIPLPSQQILKHIDKSLRMPKGLLRRQKIGRNFKRISPKELYMDIKRQLSTLFTCLFKNEVNMNEEDEN